ncbi:MAG: putative porin [Acidobacteria bacterium]|nr:putative porin [Acidobacteriota bacterium]
MRKGLVCSLVLLVCLGGLVSRAEDTATKAAKELEELKAQVAQQQEQISQLQELLRRQGALLEDLKRRLNPAGGGGAADEAAAAAAPEEKPLEARVEQLEKTVAETQKADDSLHKRLSSFSFSGDLRVRYEPFFQAGTQQRHRERARLRFEARARITDELSGGLRFATGQLEDPITTNQTFTGFFTRKDFGLDKFWLSYNPQWAPWATVTAGKFAYPWYHTELTFDNDLNPEGFAETLSFDFQDSPLTNLTLVGFQLPFNELSAGGDSFIWGGQVQSHWKLSDEWKLGLYAAGINFRNVDSIALALGAGTLRPSLPLSNSVRVDAVGNIIGYTERFAYLDLIAELNYRLAARWPLRLTFDFVNNLRGGRERSGYWAEAEIGQTREKGDLAFGYTLMRVERDAVIGAYSFSDLRASTNVLNHRFHGAYQAHRHVTLEYILFVGRLFNAEDNLSLVPPRFRPLGRDPYLKRMQFDVIYKF